MSSGPCARTNTLANRKRNAKYAKIKGQYLLGQASFPTNTALIIAISSSASQWANVAWTPTGERMGEFHLWQFVIPGVRFQLVVGKVLPLPVKALCLVRSPLKIIQVTDKVVIYLDQTRGN